MGEWWILVVLYLCHIYHNNIIYLMCHLAIFQQAKDKTLLIYVKTLSYLLKWLKHFSWLILGYYYLTFFIIEGFCILYRIVAKVNGGFIWFMVEEYYWLEFKLGLVDLIRSACYENRQYFKFLIIWFLWPWYSLRRIPGEGFLMVKYWSCVEVIVG